MKRVIFTGVFLIAACGVSAKDKPGYQSGVILQMDSASCGSVEKSSKPVAGEVLGTDGQHQTTQELLCQDYILQTDRLVFRIRPKNDKHPVFLPVGESARFRLYKDKLLLRTSETDSKERQYIVISMTPRADSLNESAAKIAPLT